MKRIGSLALVISLLAGIGCGDDDTPAPVDGGGMDSGPTDDGGPDAGPQDVQIPGLTGAVEAIQDERGMWHIYAETVDDALRVEGYLMARDRIGQLEFIRRAVTGRVTEIAGALSGCEPEATETTPCGVYLDDVAARFEGHVRNAQVIWDGLDATDRAHLQAFADGINVYIGQLRSGEERLPRGVIQTFAALMLEIEDWSPLDTLAIVRYQTAALSFDMNEDVNATLAWAAWVTAFPASSTDPGEAARAPAFHDLFPFRPVHDVYTRAGFPNVGTDTGSRALRPPRRGVTAPERRLPPMEMLRAARSVGERLEARYQRYFGDESRGSNSWVVSGSHTMSGNTLLANDPHLSLSSPALFWMVHLNTKRAGGDLNVAGIALAGTPAVLLGYNENIAWGLTVHGFDVTDVYYETVTPGTGGAADTVELDGAQVPIETFTETIEVQFLTDAGITSETRTVSFERVPHHGVIIPNVLREGARTPTEAMSVRWTGNDFSNEVAAFLGLGLAQNVDEARDAYEHFGVGGQNLVVVDQDDIFWSTQVHLPIRDPRAMTYDPAANTGIAPFQVLPGTGEYEWTGLLSDRYLPHDLNPAAGYIATANNDGVGSVSDGNPFDDDHYIGWSFADGHRIARIRERLDELVTRGNITPQDMSDLQADALSPVGRLTRDAIVAELDRALEEQATPGTHTDLETIVATLGAAVMTRIQMVRDRLSAWSFDTPAAVEGTPTAEEIADSVATTIFNAGMGRVHRGLLDDEVEALYGGAGGPGPSSRVVIWALTEPENLVTYDAGIGDTVLWDDLRTTGNTETRGFVVLVAFSDALAWLEGDAADGGAGLGTDMDEWRWGRLHTLRFETLVPQIGGDALSIPVPEDYVVPGGWPRHGDRGVVDASNFSASSTSSFSYGSGPQQRLVVEMTPDGPNVWNALPGGQAHDPDNRHHADEAELWRHNEAPPMYFTDTDVESHAEWRQQFLP